MANKVQHELNIKIGATTSKSFKSNIKLAETNLKELNSIVNRLTVGAAAAITAAGATITRALSDAMDTYTEFEQEMATVQSISGATATEFDMMREAALEAGRSTVYTAAEAASALEYMSLAGWDAEQSVAGLTPILRLAAATGKELQTTSDLVTDSMSALGLSVDDLDMYLDKVIESNNDANTSAEQLMQALVKTGGSSRVLGASLDDTITSLEVLANNGKKGEEAGTALNAILVRLAGNSTALKELSSLGVDIWDDNGKFIGLEESLTAINEAMDKLTDEDKAKSLRNVAGQRYYSQMQYLLDAVTETTDANGNVSTAWDNLESQIETSSGALDSMYAITTDTLLNAEKRLQSAIEDMQIQVVDVFSDDAKDFVSWLAETLPGVTDSITQFAEAHSGQFADGLKIAGQAIGNLLDAGIKGTEWIIDTAPDIIEIMDDVDDWFLPLKAATALISGGIDAGKWALKNKGAIAGTLVAIANGFVIVKGAVWGLKIAELFTNPLSAAITIAGLATTAIGAVGGAISAAKQEAIDADLSGHFGNLTLSLEDIDSIARQLIGEDLIDIADMLSSAMSDTNSSLSSLETIWNSLQKSDWKINMGFDFDSDAYESEIESYVAQAQAYVEDKAYEVHVATTLLLGDNSGIDFENNEFYSILESNLIDLQQKLQDKLKESLDDDGIIDIDEEKIIQAYLGSIQMITDGITEAERTAKFDALSLKYSLADMDADSFLQLEEDMQQYAEEISDSALQAYESAAATLNYRFNKGDLTKEDYISQLAEYENAYYQSVADVNMQAAQYIIDAAREAYPELESAMGEYENVLNDIIDQYLNGGIDERFWTDMEDSTWASMSDELIQSIRGLIDNDATKDALATIQDGITPVIELLRNDMELMEDAGADKDAVDNIRNFLDTYDQITSIIGKNDTNILSDTGELVAENQDAQDYITMLGLNYDAIFTDDTADKIESAINEKTERIAEDTYNTANAYLKKYFGDLGLDFDVNVGVTGRITINAEESRNELIQEKLASKGIIRDVYENAEGGIYSRPILTTFAEDGAEAAIPLDGSKRAKQLWIQSGDMLGMFGEGIGRDSRILERINGSENLSRDQSLLNAISNGDSSGNGTSVQIQFSPNVTIQGNATQEEVQAGISLSLEDLRDMLKEITRADARVRF